MKVSTGPFLAGGKFDAKANLRGLADECMLLMCKQLSKDWPSSFLQVSPCYVHVIYCVVQSLLMISICWVQGI